MDYKLIISITALVISSISLIWNIWIKIQAEKKKILIQCHKINYETNCSFVITLTNIGKKPIYIRRIEIFELVNKETKITNINYSDYKDLFENKPLNPDDWRTVVLKDPKKTIFVDTETGKLKTNKVVIVEPNNKKYITKWFKQNNFKKTSW
ncbi:hypothetical protein [Flavobacterium macrobrachii]|jgi:hypothetical protein|uniref:hypothetical protein n=1 Tax=Flavobacterium macrobrachii TaxID=591204 RepID=UPI0037C038FB